MEEARIWLEKAQEDFETAVFIADHDRYPYAAFLFQQAAEKALKAAIINNKNGLPKTHDCFLLAKKADAPENVLTSADALSSYYFRTRYPDVEGVELDNADIKRVKNDAETVVTWVEEKHSKR